MGQVGNENYLTNMVKGLRTALTTVLNMATEGEVEHPDVEEFRNICTYVIDVLEYDSRLEERRRGQYRDLG